MKTSIFSTGLLAALFLFSGIACAESIQPVGGTDYLLYITFIIAVLTFVLAFINFKNINLEKELLEEARKEIIRQKLNWQKKHGSDAGGPHEEESEELSNGLKDLASEEIKLEKNLATVEVYLKELEELKEERKKDMSKIESELARIQAERQKIAEDEKKIADDKSRIEQDIKNIEEMWLDVENAMKTVTSARSKKKKDE